MSLTEAKDIIDMYDSPRDTGLQLEKFLQVLAQHKKQLEEQMADLQANLDELKVHQREAKALLVKSKSKTPPAAPATTPKSTTATAARKKSHAA